MKRKKITSADVRLIKEGQSKLFHVPNVKDIRTAQTLAYRLGRFEPELGVTFSTSVNFDDLSIKIMAEKRV